MARAAKLKVFRTPIGFHDAYVAAPSRKSALEAWGADSNLFATGSAEQVDDPELMREPLEKPGQVIRRLRGTLAEHVAALPKKAAGQAKGTAKSGRDETHAAAARASPPRPRPSRSALDRAEAALAKLDERQGAARAQLARRQAELDRERRALDAKQERERGKLQARIEAARDRYDEAIRIWRADQGTWAGPRPAGRGRHAGGGAGVIRSPSPID